MNDLVYTLDASLGWMARLYWLPVLAWSLIALPVLLSLALWKRLHPRLQLDLRLAMLLALPAGILLMALAEIRLPARIELPVQNVIPEVFLQSVQTAKPVPATPTDMPWLGLAALLATGIALVYGGWLLYQAITLYRLHRQEGALTPEWLEKEVREVADLFGIRRTVRLIVSQRISIPCTYGWRHPIVVIPEALLQDRPSLHLALLHEILHVRRHDYAWRWAERIVSLFFGINPLVWILRRQIDNLREIVCDNEVVCLDPQGAGDYARLLVSFSPVLPNRLVVSVGMAEGAANLKRRIAAMKRHILERTQLVLIRRASLLLAVLVLAAGSLVVAGTEALARTGETLEVDNLSDAVAIIQAPVRSLLPQPAEVPADTDKVTVRGTVRDEDGLPVVGANVTVVATQLGASTDRNGNFTLRNVPKGSELRFTHALGEGKIRSVTLFPANEVHVQVSLPSKMVDTDTARQITIRGMVRNTSGAPIAGAHVIDMGRYTTRPDGAVIYKSTKTQHDGSFVLENVTVDSEIMATTKGFRSSVQRAQENMTFVLRSAEIQPHTETIGRRRANTDTVYVIVDQMPSFPGGAEALRSYLSENFKTPDIAKRAGVQGRVFVTFIVEKDGTISDPQVARGIGAGCDEEAIRVVNAMPKWNPGRHAGEPKAVRYSVPVSCNAE